MIRPLLAAWIAAVLLACSGQSTAIAAKPADSLLPASTKGYLCVPDLCQLREQFNNSEFGKLANDPSLQPFVEDFKRQLRQQGIKQSEQLGLSWDELEGVPGGEVALAVVQVSVDEMAIVA